MTAWPDVPLTKFAEAYGIENVHDWGRTEANGVLLSNGAGAMLSAMDCLPWLRYAWDVSHVKVATEAMLSFAEIVGARFSPIAGVLVFWTDNPAPVRALFARMPEAKIACYSNEPMPGLAVDSHAALAHALSIGLYEHLS
jgi:hypothetical protein